VVVVIGFWEGNVVATVALASAAASLTGATASTGATTMFLMPVAPNFGAVGGP